MIRTLRRLPLLIGSMLAVLVAGSALAAGPVLMPGFPMRMGPNVMLMWTPVPGATQYNVYRSDKRTEDGPKLATVPMNNHMDVNVPMDKDAYYRIKAVMADGKESEAGPEGLLAGVKPLDAPKWTGELYQEGQLSLRWDQVQGAAFYNVYKAEAKEGPFALAGSVQETKFVDSKVEEGKTYWYQVSAVDKNNSESPKGDVKEYAVAKAVAVAKAKVYPLVEKMVKKVAQWYGPDEFPFRGPAVIAPDRERNLLYVAMTGGLVALDAEGQIVQVFKAPAGYQGNWGQPFGVAVDPKNGEVWSTWAPGGQVRHLAADGALIKEWTLALPKEDFVKDGREKDWEHYATMNPLPYGIEVDGQGRVWVVDNAFAQVSVFDADGTLLKRIGNPKRNDFEPQDMKSLTLPLFHRPTGRVYVLDPTVQYVRAFSPELDFIKNEDGSPNYGWSKGGSGPGYFQLTKGFGVTPDGNFVIVDGVSNRVQAFDPQMEYLYNFVTKAGQPAPSELGTPVSVAFLKNRMYVTELLSDRITVFEIQP